MQALTRVAGILSVTLFLSAVTVSCAESPAPSEKTPAAEEATGSPQTQESPQETTQPPVPQPAAADPSERPGQQEASVEITSKSAAQSAPTEAASPGKTYYVRQTVGNDTNDGLSPETAWEHIAKLSGAMHAGDTAYVGPGLYREQITILHDGAIDKRITFIADTTGQHTGDPPGHVMITGADPVDPAAFTPTSVPGVYELSPVPARPVQSVVEMDGDQYRYARARDTREHLLDGLSEREVVDKLPHSFFYDREANVLYIHTSDGKSPETHEIELIRRGNGISMTDKHFVTVVGFTFRHTGDAGINFFKRSGDGVAIDNISWGSRQGIRVYNATNVLVYRNTLFRNDNCGVYFAADSTNGAVLANTAYENIKGVRWSSNSVSGMAIDNALFDNHEAGISVEKAHRALLRRNRLVNNGKSQLLVIQAEYDSDDNCFKNGNADQLTADFVFTEHYKTLAEYQEEKHLDLNSKEGGCGPLPDKIDVRKLHKETMAYTDRAREILKRSAKAADAEVTPPSAE
jgi:parallel beta-helix repeat protein